MNNADFFGSTVDESWMDSMAAFNNVAYDITDKQMTTWKKQSKTGGGKLSASASKRKDADRFIPIRDEHKFDQQQTYHTDTKRVDAAHNGNGNDNDDDDGSSHVHRSDSTAEYEQHKILSFKTKAPEPSDGYISNLRVLYTVGAQNGGVKSQHKGKHRHINQTAERILDAPDLMDDFYLNLLDWSCGNVIAIGLGSSVYLWNSENGEISLLHDYAGNNNSSNSNSNNDDVYVCSVAWNHNGQYVAVGDSKHAVTLFDQTGKTLRKLSGHCNRVSSLSWNHSVLSTGCADSTIRNHDVRKKKSLVSVFGCGGGGGASGGGAVADDAEQQHEQEICGLRWDHNVSGKYLASGSNDNKCCVWCLENTTRPVHQFTESLSAVKALAWCPWNRSLLANGGGSGDRKIRVYSVTDGTLCHYVDTESQVCSLIWNPFEKELLSSHGFSRNQLSIWKYPSLKKTHDLTGHTSRVLHTALSPNGEMVCSAAADETLRFWKVFENTSRKRNSRGMMGDSDEKRKPNALNLRIR
eukprot:CAMPEP_0202691048 /NCGR_PEP_ID=MMETSP1385-20130828/5871_1 /ASSEMBLY_ACC=CAM_ASM_000861 /TAXON_ID=933848 /ORGANISM="Elphidium margaritaceum" /LENGTH=522 /DNA_ID=CAMNT_0049346393 /DNA_START=80 /DNA_END=1648 /DNA_ORIENTATION=-